MDAAGLSALRDPVRLAYLCIHEPDSLGKVQSKCHRQTDQEEAHLVPLRLVKAYPMAGQPMEAE